MIVGVLNNKKIYLAVTELFIRGHKLSVSLVFITQSYFAAPKSIRLNFTHYFVMKILSFNKPQSVIHQILTLETF